eukprot:TRINITY_DN871_c0_g1_i1.p1 TRINITY_DN871_c0_g1~~TRINITY_DN871_c0_g1_i1.p1  ORF type:complete len:373 (+),score=110.05 TRINITY_DN871_c0_g1_i1:66-1184(+)
MCIRDRYQRRVHGEQLFFLIRRFTMLQKFVKSALKANTRSFASSKLFSKEPVRVAVTGAAGQIGYSLVFRIAAGEMLGKDQPVILHLIDLPNAQDSLNGVAMELNDCAFPLLAGVVTTDQLATGFKDVSHCLLVGAKPRGPGMERADLLKENGKIFTQQGKAIDENASFNCKILVVGNPANTNALIAASQAKRIPKSSFTAMMRLDHNRALYQLAEKANVHVSEINNFTVWGNHSPTMFPDITSSTIRGRKATEVIDNNWYTTNMIPSVQQRGAAIIKARKLSSAASAAHAAIEHIRDWEFGSNGKWVSMGVLSDGTHYDIPSNIMFGFPIVCENGKFRIIENVPVPAESRQRLDVTRDELLAERKAIENLL